MSVYLKKGTSSALLVGGNIAIDSKCCCFPKNLIVDLYYLGNQSTAGCTLAWADHFDYFTFVVKDDTGSNFTGQINIGVVSSFVDLFYSPGGPPCSSRSECFGNAFLTVGAVQLSGGQGAVNFQVFSCASPYLACGDGCLNHNSFMNVRFFDPSSGVSATIDLSNQGGTPTTALQILLG